MYLLECNVSGIDYVDSTWPTFRRRFDCHKACSRKLHLGTSETHAEFIRHVTEEGHPEFLKYIGIAIIDRRTERQQPYKQGIIFLDT